MTLAEQQQQQQVLEAQTTHHVLTVDLPVRGARMKE